MSELYSWSSPIFVFDQKLYSIFVSKINFLHQVQYITLHYKKAYYHKKFQNFSIKTVIIIAYETSKMNFGHLGVNSQDIFLNSKLISNVNYNRKIRGNY